LVNIPNLLVTQELKMTDKWSNYPYCSRLLLCSGMNSSKHYERTLVAILFFTWGTVFLDRMSPLYLAPYFAPEFHLSHAQIGTLASVLAITWAASTFFFGALSDRVGRRRLLIPAVFVFSILSWMTGLAHSFHQLLWIRGLMGLAEGPTWSIMTALIEESSDAKRRGRNIGFVVSAAALVGLAAAPVLTTQVAARWGWRSAFFLAGVPGFLMGALIWKFVKEPVPVESETREKLTLRDYVSILRYRNMWLCCLGTTGFMSWLFALNVFAPLYITEVAHEPATTAGLLLGASGLGSFFLGFLLPSLSDRIGRRPILLFSAAVSAVIPLAFLVPMLYVYPFLLAAIVFVANSGQGMASLLMVLVPTESVPPQFRATSIGLATLVGEIFGATAAPIVVGNLAEKYGLSLSMWMAAGGSAVVFLVALFLRETYQRSGSDMGLSRFCR
jgi:predicted MFS family arabinose efflux permease